jgi:hypothetical protein
LSINDITMSSGCGVFVLPVIVFWVTKRSLCLHGRCSGPTAPSTVAAGGFRVPRTT